VAEVTRMIMEDTDGESLLDPFEELTDDDDE
jgi:hypothetical protein